MRTLLFSKEKKQVKRSTKASLFLTLWLAIHKEVMSKPKQPSCKRSVPPQKGQCEKVVKSKKL